MTRWSMGMEKWEKCSPSSIMGELKETGRDETANGERETKKIN